MSVLVNVVVITSPALANVFVALLDVSAVTATVGAIESTLILTVPAVDTFPAASLAVAVKVFTP